MVKRYQIVLAAMLLVPTVSVLPNSGESTTTTQAAGGGNGVSAQSAQVPSLLLQSPRIALAHVVLFAAAFPVYYYGCRALWNSLSEATQEKIQESMGLVAIVGSCLLAQATGVNLGCFRLIAYGLQGLINATSASDSK